MSPFFFLSWGIIDLHYVSFRCTCCLLIPTHSSLLPLSLQPLATTNVFSISIVLSFQECYVENSLAVLWLGLGTFTAGSWGSVFGWGAKIPQAVQWGRPPKKNTVRIGFFFFFCSQHNSEEIHPSRCIYHQFTTFCFCVAFHDIDTSL